MGRGAVTHPTDGPVFREQTGRLTDPLSRGLLCARSAPPAREDTPTGKKVV